MRFSKWVLLFAAMVVLIPFLILPLGAQQKKNALSDLASSTAVITKLDWLLLKAQVEVMRQTQPVSDVGWPMYHYDQSSSVLWASVFVNDKWLAHADTKTANKELRSKGITYCSTPFFSDPKLESLFKNKATGCAVLFYTWGKTKRVDLATYFIDTDELVLK